MDVKKIVWILIGVVLIAFGIGIYSLKVNDEFKFVNNISSGFIKVNSKDGIVKIGNRGIEVIDGDDHISIGFDGIHVNDGVDKVSVGWDGINIQDGNYSRFSLNPGRWFGVGSRKMINSSIDEERFLDIDSINEIAVLSPFIDVKVTSEDRDDVRVNYYGEMRSNIVPKLETNKTSNTLQIKLETAQINNYAVANSSVVLEVFIPESFKDNFTFSNSSGNIYMKNLTSNVIQASASSGNIILEDIQANSLILSTSSGNIQGEDFIAELQASSSSGNISLDLEEINDNVKVSTSSGNVQIELSEDSNYKIQGSSSSGRYTPSNNMIVEENEKGRFKAVIGTGENSIDISTSSGDVVFRE